jgi:very-short-patch-repair endonuclease
MPTDAEAKLWHLLRDRRMAGFKFRRQHPLGRYILDFYCHEALLVVELDGGQHTEAKQMAYDERRTGFLASQGVRVLRFGDHDMLKWPEAVAEQVYRALPVKA